MMYRTSAGLPHADSHSNDDMEIKPGIAEMIREEERVSFNHFVCHLIYALLFVAAPVIGHLYKDFYLML